MAIAQDREKKEEKKEKWEHIPTKSRILLHNQTKLFIFIHTFYLKNFCKVA